jgi:hypothetical protein
MLIMKADRLNVYGKIITVYCDTRHAKNRLRSCTLNGEVLDILGYNMCRYLWILVGKINKSSSLCQNPCCAHKSSNALSN